MSRKAGDDREYVRVTAKVPIRDKDGNDISGDKLSLGGRRKEDGSLSALAYDLELIEETDDPQPDDLDVRLREYALEEQCIRAEQEENIQATVDLIFAFIEAATVYLQNHPEVGVKIVDGVVSFGKNVAGKFRSLKAKLIPRKPSNNSQQKRTASVIKATAPNEAEPKSLPAQAIKGKSKKKAMTIEQTRLEVLQILAHYIEMKKGLQRLSDSNYIELQKFGFNEMIAQLEGIVQQYPALMDDDTETNILKIGLDELESARVRETLLAHPSDQEGK